MVAQALKDYYDEHAQFVESATNARSHEVRLNKHFTGYFVSQLTPAKIKEYIRSCENEGRSNGTTRRELAHLQAALNHEVGEQRIIHAPKLVLPEPPPARERTFSSAELGKILKEAEKTPHLHTSLQIMLETGQRPKAIETLTWFQVDFKEREIHFAKTQRKQTNKRVRTVAMSDSLYTLLKRLHASRGGTGYVVERIIPLKEGKQKVVKAGNVRKTFAKACKNARIKKVKGQGRYTIRHTFGDSMDRAGVDDKTIGDIMGHTKVQTTRKHYIKKNMERQREALNTAQLLHNAKRGKNASH